MSAARGPGHSKLPYSNTSFRELPLFNEKDRQSSRLHCNASCLPITRNLDELVEGSNAKHVKKDHAYVNILSLSYYTM